MTVAEAQGWLIILTPVLACILSIATLFRVGVVHTLVNSAMTQEKTENALLRGLLVSKQMEIDIAEKTRLALAIGVSAATLIQPLIVPKLPQATTNPVPPILAP